MKSTEELIAEIENLNESKEEWGAIRAKKIEELHDEYIEYIKPMTDSEFAQGLNRIDSHYNKLIAKDERAIAFLEFQLYLRAKKDQIFGKKEEPRMGK
mgnify:CR=1 FL=1